MKTLLLAVLPLLAAEPAVQVEQREGALLLRCTQPGAEELVLVWSINGETTERSWAPPESLWPPGTVRLPRGRVASPMTRRAPGSFELEVPVDKTVVKLNYRVAAPAQAKEELSALKTFQLQAPPRQASAPAPASAPASAPAKKEGLPDRYRKNRPECWTYRDKYSVWTHPENLTLFESWGGGAKVVTKPVTFDRKSWSDQITLYWKSEDFGGVEEVEKVLADSENVYECMKEYFGVSWLRRKPTAFYMKEDLRKSLEKRKWAGLAYGDKLYIATGERFSVPVMAHELTHFMKFSHRSRALSEGLAAFVQYFGTRQDTAEVLRSIHGEAARRLASAPLKTSLVRLGPEIFYDTDPGYMLACSLTAYLVFEEDGLNALMRFMDGQEFVYAFGVQPEAMEERWKEFLRSRPW